MIGNPRQIVYGFLSLPCSVRRKILTDLDVYASDANINYIKSFGNLKTQGKVELFFNKVEDEVKKLEYNER